MGNETQIWESRGRSLQRIYKPKAAHEPECTWDWDTLVDTLVWDLVGHSCHSLLFSMLLWDTFPARLP